MDVVTINGSDRQLESLGITEQALEQINPNVILCQFDAYGGPLPGPRSHHPGYDDLAQASTGIMARFGGGLATPEEHAHFGTIDVLGGYCAALAIGMALVQRADGRGAAVARSSLAAAGQLIQAPFMFDYKGRAPFNEPSGREVKGEHALYQCYQAQDGWLFLAAKPERVTELAAIPELADIGEQAQARLEPYLAERIRTQPLAYWQQTLLARDIGCQPTVTMNALREQTRVVESQEKPDLLGPTISFIRHDRHPSGRWVDLIAPNAIRPRRAPVIIPAPMPKYGQHTRSLLGELGYAESDIDALLAQGVVSESWSTDYLPD